MIKTSQSVDLIRLVAYALGELNDSAVFVGGATVPFYIPEVYWPQARATEDVDVVLEVMGRKENWATEKRLREKGFTNDVSEGAPICRWVYKGLKVDVMSPDGEIFGFTNQWYKEGVEKAVQLKSPLPEVKILSLPYFLATKMEAFLGRGHGDYQGSPDMEDIISVLETHQKDKMEISLKNTSDELKSYLDVHLNHLKANNDFLDALPGATFNRVDPIEGSKSVIDSIELILKKVGDGI
jgi:hypothetical protein